jgi:hypothetical protein
MATSIYIQKPLTHTPSLASTLPDHAIFMSFRIADMPEEYTPPGPLPIGDIILATISLTNSWAIELGYSNTFLADTWGCFALSITVSW